MVVIDSNMLCVHRFILRSYNLQKQMYYVRTCGMRLLKCQKLVFPSRQMTLLQLVQVSILNRVLLAALAEDNQFL